VRIAAGVAPQDRARFLGDLSRKCSVDADEAVIDKGCDGGGAQRTRGFKTHEISPIDCAGIRGCAPKRRRSRLLVIRSEERERCRAIESGEHHGLIRIRAAKINARRIALPPHVKRARSCLLARPDHALN
jgi:hypothetical protein